MKNFNEVVANFAKSISKLSYKELCNSCIPEIIETLLDDSLKNPLYDEDTFFILVDASEWMQLELELEKLEDLPF